MVSQYSVLVDPAVSKASPAPRQKAARSDDMSPSTFERQLENQRQTDTKQSKNDAQQSTTRDRSQPVPAETSSKAPANVGDENLTEKSAAEQSVAVKQTADAPDEATEMPAEATTVEPNAPAQIVVPQVSSDQIAAVLTSPQPNTDGSKPALPATPAIATANGVITVQGQQSATANSAVTVQGQQSATDLGQTKDEPALPQTAAPTVKGQNQQASIEPVVASNANAANGSRQETVVAPQQPVAVSQAPVQEDLVPEPKPAPTIYTAANETVSEKRPNPQAPIQSQTANPVEQDTHVITPVAKEGTQPNNTVLATPVKPAAQNVKAQSAEQPVVNQDTVVKSAAPDQTITPKLATTELSEETATVAKQPVSDTEKTPVQPQTQAKAQVIVEPEARKVATPVAVTEQAVKAAATPVAHDKQTAEQSEAPSVKPEAASKAAPLNAENTVVQGTDKPQIQSTQQPTQQFSQPPVQTNTAQSASSANTEGAATTEKESTEPIVKKSEVSENPLAENKVAVSKAPKGDAFSKMMAQIEGQQGLKDLASLSEQTIRVDTSVAQQTEVTTVRLTGMEQFNRTGQLPPQATLANAQAIAAQISKFSQKGDTRFEIRLDPADLGKVDVRLTIGSDGQTRAHLFVEKSETLDFLMRDQRVLERGLQQSGLNLDKQGLEFSLMDQKGQGQQMAQNDADQFDQPNGDEKQSSSEEHDPSASILEPQQTGNYSESNGLNLVI